MGKGLIDRGEGQVPYIQCPLVNFERPVGSCMTRCVDTDLHMCAEIKLVSIEELDEIAPLLQDAQSEQWEERRDMINSQEGGGVISQSSPEEAPEGDTSEDDEDYPEEADDDTEEQDTIEESPVVNNENEEKVDETPPEKGGKKKRRTRSDKGKKKKRVNRGPKPALKDTYILVCGDTARILENADDEAVRKEVSILSADCIAAYQEQMDELEEIGDETGRGEDIRNIITAIEEGKGVRIFQASKELGIQVHVALVAV